MTKISVLVIISVILFCVPVVRTTTTKISVPSDISDDCGSGSGGNTVKISVPVISETVVAVAATPSDISASDIRDDDGSGGNTVKTSVPVTSETVVAAAPTPSRYQC
ncbi:hypothetical protein E4U40_007768 [Claviceps sp. LM458 group G5]|nr:hypothetical protein E4U40_007768 [Claviceps sp. LM458 group G5]